MFTTRRGQMTTPALTLGCTLMIVRPKEAHKPTHPAGLWCTKLETVQNSDSRKGECCVIVDVICSAKWASLPVPRAGMNRRSVSNEAGRDSDTSRTTLAFTISLTCYIWHIQDAASKHIIKS